MTRNRVKNSKSTKFIVMGKILFIAKNINVGDGFKIRDMQFLNSDLEVKISSLSTTNVDRCWKHFYKH